MNNVSPMFEEVIPYDPHAWDGYKRWIKDIEETKEVTSVEEKPKKASKKKEPKKASKKKKLRKGVDFGFHSDAPSDVEVTRWGYYEEDGSWVPNEWSPKTEVEYGDSDDWSKASPGSTGCNFR